MNGLVLLVDDDREVRDALEQTLLLADYKVISAQSYIEAKDHITPDFQGVIVSDIRMPGKDGFDLLELVQRVDADLPVILLTGEGDIPMAVRGIQSGAFAFLEKPCAPSELIDMIARGARARGLVIENRQLRQQVNAGDAAARMIFGTSVLAENLRVRVRTVAKATAEVLISGAPGSGLSKIAEVIHLLSFGPAFPFLKKAAAGLSPDAMAGALQEAESGSLFIDEVGSLPLDTQFGLREYLDDAPKVRVLSGTTQDLLELVEHGGFNADLYYKLDVMQVRIPALKERPEDIPVLFRHYVRLACEQAGLAEPEISPEVVSRLMAQDWPGNARALMNAAMRFAMGLSDGAEATELGLSEQLAQVEVQLLTDALRRHHGNATETAKALKLPRKTFYDKLAKYGLRAEEYR